MKKVLSILLLLLPFWTLAQQANEIYLFDMVVKKDKIILSNPQNITNHKGYDNQPFFHPTQPIIYYTSAIDTNNTDIKYYNYKTKTTYQFTHTPQINEFSPTVTPDGKYISCIIQRPNGQQDLCKYPIANSNDSAIVLINDLKVGYHTWIDKSNLFLFILGDSSNDLHYYKMNTKKDTILAKKIGRAMHKIPDENAMSFVEKSNDSSWWIKKFDLDKMRIRDITKTIKSNEDLAWLKNGTILESNGDTIFCLRPPTNADIQNRLKSLPRYDMAYDMNGIYIERHVFYNESLTILMVGNTSMLKKITRIAVNKKNNKVAIVVGE